jgi:hypothetical protein
VQGWGIRRRVVAVNKWLVRPEHGSVVFNFGLFVYSAEPERNPARAFVLTVSRASPQRVAAPAVLDSQFLDLAEIRARQVRLHVGLKLSPAPVARRYLRNVNRNVGDIRLALVIL